MTATTPTRAPIERTEHPHVVKRADTRGGEPCVGGTSLAVRHVLHLHRDLGESVESIAQTYKLTVAEVYDALSYAYDHPDEIARYEEENRLRTVMRTQDLVLVGDRLVSRRQLREIDVPEGTSVYTWETLPDALAE
jgi:uncharacterized protein (DUF433 family)